MAFAEKYSEGHGMTVGRALPLLLVALALGGCGAPESKGNIVEGATAPGFILPAAEGPPVSLEEFRGKRSVLLYFSMGPG
jgi:hypothetical protein